MGVPFYFFAIARAKISLQGKWTRFCTILLMACTLPLQFSSCYEPQEVIYSHMINWKMFLCRWMCSLLITFVLLKSESGVENVIFTTHRWLVQQLMPGSSTP